MYKTRRHIIAGDIHWFKLCPVGSAVLSGAFFSAFDLLFQGVSDLVWTYVIDIGVILKDVN